MSKYVPHAYQFHALKWLIQRTLIDGHAGGAYFLDPGLGKTSITLAWLRLLKMLNPESKVLVVAPMRVMYSTWPAECQKWAQFRNLTTSIVHGSPTQRMAALTREADLYLINPEGIPWLANYYAKRPIPFETLVVDESSKFKTWGAQRTKALRKLVPQFQHRLILTGTPSPNSLEDLFAQVFIVDGGDALGTGISKFRNRYFYRGGYGGYKYVPNQGAQQSIEDKIANLCLRLSAADHLDLPDLLINDVWVDLPGGVMGDYKRLEKEMFLELENGEDLPPANAGTKYIACKQMANGGIYVHRETRQTNHLHKVKIEALTDIVDELQGKPVLVAFQYHHDLERIRQVYKAAPSIDGNTGGRETDKLINQWNGGELPLLAVQPQALSHGVNMQAGPGRDVVWLGLTDNLETYLQFNARIHRQGVTGQVRVHRILANRTVDVAVRDRIESKNQGQQALLDALNKYRTEIA